MALENIKNHFSGLPMESLIGAPLKAACDSQVMLARSTVDFIRDVGFDGDKTRTADFSYTRHRVVGKDVAGNDIFGDERVGLEVPVLAIVNIPSLMIDDVNITFDMEVKSSETSKSEESKEGKFSAKTKVGWGPFSATASISGSVSSHKENTRSSDNSAKYHVSVNAKQGGTPEGLLRVLDIIAESVAPKSVDSDDRKALDNTGEAKTKVENALKEVNKARLGVNKAEKLLDIEREKLKLNPDDSTVDVGDKEQKLIEAKTKLLDNEAKLAAAYEELDSKLLGGSTGGNTNSNTSDNQE